MKIDPERILKMLDERAELELMESEANEHLDEELEKILALFELEHSGAPIVRDIKNHIRNLAENRLAEGKELTVEDVKEQVKRTLKFHLMYRVPYAEIPATIMKKIERLLENNGETIDRIIEENRKYVEKICKNIMKYLKSSIDARKARKAIFGMDEYDTITLEKLVYLIYSCLKHAIVEDEEENKNK